MTDIYKHMTAVRTLLQSSIRKNPGGGGGKTFGHNQIKRNNDSVPKSLAKIESNNSDFEKLFPKLRKGIKNCGRNNVPLLFI